MILLALAISIILYQIFWYFLIPDFKVKNLFYVLSPIITAGFCAIWYYYHKNIDFSILPYLLIILTLSNLSFVDCKHYEVSGRSYWFLLIPACAILFMQGNQLYLKHIALHKKLIEKGISKLSMSEKISLMNAVNKLEI